MVRQSSLWINDSQALWWDFWFWSHMQLDHLVWGARKGTAGLLCSLLCNPGIKERNWRHSAVLSLLCPLSGISMTVLLQLSSLLRQLHDKYYLLIITWNCKYYWNVYISDTKCVQLIWLVTWRCGDSYSSDTCLLHILIRILMTKPT